MSRVARAPRDVIKAALVDVMATRIVDKKSIAIPNGKTSMMSLGRTSPAATPGKSVAPAAPATPIGTDRRMSSTPAMRDPLTAVLASLADCQRR